MISSNLIRNGARTMLTRSIYSLKEVCKLQEDAMLNEKCILVDENDKNLGEISKKDCHVVLKNDEIKLHRAFSVFLFNEDGDMLIQRRSSHKVNLHDSSYRTWHLQNPILRSFQGFHLHFKFFFQTFKRIFVISVFKFLLDE
jgi:hypothetical protein